MGPTVFFFFFSSREVGAREIFTLGNLKLQVFKNKPDTSIFATLCGDFSTRRECLCLLSALLIASPDIREFWRYEDGWDGKPSGRNCGQFASSTQGQDIHAALKELNQSATMSHSHNEQDQLADFYICNHFTVSPSVSCTHLLLPSISSDCQGGSRAVFSLHKMHSDYVSWGNS